MSHFTFVIMPKALDAMSSGSWLERKRWPFIPTRLSKGAEEMLDTQIQEPRPKLPLSAKALVAGTGGRQTAAKSAKALECERS